VSSEIPITEASLDQRLRRAVPIALVVAVLAAFGAGAAGADEHVLNGSFERSVAGWRGENARVIRVAGGTVGSGAARVTALRSGRAGARTVALPATATGTELTAQSWVRSRAGTRTLCLQLVEGAAPTGARTCARIARGWRLLRFRYLTRTSGRQLLVRVSASRLGRRGSFDMDGVSVVEPPPAMLLAAGDIASCSSSGDEATAALLDRLPGTIAALGDLAYERGTAQEFGSCYAQSWGRLVARTRPTPGNHEYLTPGAAPYYAYFGAVAGTAGQGWYSYDLGSWHVVVLNSNCGPAGGCGAGSPQARWLRADLAAHRTTCSLAYWHHPRFSSGLHGSDATVTELWRAFQEGGGDVVLVGHDHHYERFAPQTADGALDRTNGVREFLVGTGGRSHYPVLRTIANSEVHEEFTYGVLSLTLRSASYDWRFVPVAGSTFTDSGSADCR
jgi:hypothetical protein